MGALAQQKHINPNNRLVMTDDQMERLASIGFRFTNKQSTWEERIEQLVEYKAKHGDTLVPVAYTQHNNFGRWVTYVKRQWSLNKLPPDRIATLEAIGFDFTVRKIHRLPVGKYELSAAETNTNTDTDNANTDNTDNNGVNNNTIDDDNDNNIITDTIMAIANPHHHNWQAYNNLPLQ